MFCWQGILNARPRWGAIICSVSFSEVSVNNSSASEVSKILKPVDFKLCLKKNHHFQLEGDSLVHSLPSHLFPEEETATNCSNLQLSTGSIPDREKMVNSWLFIEGRVIGLQNKNGVQEVLWGVQAPHLFSEVKRSPGPGPCLCSKEYCLPCLWSCVWSGPPPGSLASVGSRQTQSPHPSAPWDLLASPKAQSPGRQL